MKQEVSLLKEELEGEEEESASKSVFKWFFSNIKFLLIPASRLKELTIREREYDKTVSKRKFLRRLKSTLTIIGIGLVLYVVTLAVHGAWISPYTFQEADAVYNAPLFWAEPSPAHPLGNTYMGRDVLARMIYGARASLTMALPAIGLSLGCGILFGVIAGYAGGWIDSIIMRFFDILLAFPALIFAIVFVSIFGRSLSIIILAYGILGIPYYSRLIRGNVLQAKQLPYVQAARVSGSKNWRIMFRHILPNTIQPIIISFTLDIGGVILSFAGLAFLGYSDPDLIEWGKDISEARGHILDAPWASLFPGLMIVITVLGFMLLGDGLRDALDPRLKNL